MATRELVDAVRITRARSERLLDDAYAAITAARAGGTSELAAMNANALERQRVASILPSTPDNDRLADRLRQLHGEPSQLKCDLTERR